MLHLRRAAPGDAVAAAEEDARDKRQRYDVARAELAGMLHRVDLVRRFEIQRALLDSAAAHACFFGAGVDEMSMLGPFFVSVMQNVDQSAQAARQAQAAVLAQQQLQYQGPGSIGGGDASALQHQQSQSVTSRLVCRSSSATSLAGLGSGTPTPIPTPPHSRNSVTDISDTGSAAHTDLSPDLQGPPSWVPPIGSGAVSQEDRQRSVGAAMAATARSGRKGILHCGYLLKQSHSVYQSWNVRSAPLRILHSLRCRTPAALPTCGLHDGLMFVGTCDQPCSTASPPHTRSPCSCATSS